MTIQLSKNLKALRKENNMTQEKPAERVNVSVGVISKWERGVSEPELLSLIAIAEVFKVSVDVLIGYNMINEGPEEMAEMIQSLTTERNFTEAMEVSREALRNLWKRRSTFTHCLQLHSNITGKGRFFVPFPVFCIIVRFFLDLSLTEVLKCHRQDNFLTNFF